MDIYEEIAELMRSSIGGRDLPRDVIIRKARETWPDPEQARAMFEHLKAEGEAFAANTVAMYYDPVDLAIARQKQRALK